MIEHNAKVEQARRIYSDISFSMMTIEQCYIKLKQLNATHFIDLEFEPSDKSVFDPIVDNPLDVAVHWRRP